MEFEVPKRHIFQCLQCPLTWSNRFCGEGGKGDALVEGKKQGPHHRDVIIMIFQ